MYECVYYFKSTSKTIKKDLSQVCIMQKIIYLQINIYTNKINNDN